MPRSTTDTNESRKRLAHLARVFSVVIQRYRDLCNLYPIAASQIDSDAPSNRRLDFAACDYKIDIENACVDAIAGQINRTELEDTIDRLIAGDHSVSEGITRQAVRLVGTEFEKRGLEPAKYLKRIKRGRGERVTP